MHKLIDHRNHSLQTIIIVVAMENYIIASKIINKFCDVIVFHFTLSTWLIKPTNLWHIIKSGLIYFLRFLAKISTNVRNRVYGITFVFHHSLRLQNVFRSISTGTKYIYQEWLLILLRAVRETVKYGCFKPWVIYGSRLTNT